MKNLKQNYSGFSAVEAVLIIFVLLVLASGGYYVYRANHKTKPIAATSSAPNKDTGTSQSQTNPDMSTWKTYASTFEGASFKYPSNWKLTNNGALDGVTNGDSASLKAPDGFEISWDAPLSGIGGACDINTDFHVFLDKIIPLSVTGSKNPLSIVVTSSGGAKSLSVVDGYAFSQSGTMPATGDLGICMLYPTFESQKFDQYAATDSSPASILFSAQDVGGSNNMTDDQYLASPDVQTAEKIFESLTY